MSHASGNGQRAGSASRPVARSFPVRRPGGYRRGRDHDRGGSRVALGGAFVESTGSGPAVGIPADAFLVRMTLVPAFMAIAADRMRWLPRWPARFRRPSQPARVTT